MEHNTPLSQDPVERLLEDVGREPMTLRPEAKVLHKQQLLSLAERLQQEAAETVKAVPQAPETPRRSFWQQARLVLGSAGAGFAVALCALVLFMNIRHTPQTVGSIDAFGRVLIPAAHATDAFQIYTDQDAPKVAEQSALILHSKVALSAAQVERVLQVDTGHIEHVERVSADTFRVRIASVPANAVVRVALPAAIQTEAAADAPVAREYSWALQSTDKLELVSSLPANNANGVPLDASLELVMNAQNFTNVTTSIEITPPTEGSFQVNGRRIIFLPAKPWKASTLYSVRMKQGFTAENLALPKDLLLQFQTGDGTTDTNNAPWIRVFGEFQEVYVGDTMSVQLSRSPGLATSGSAISVTGYRLTEDEAAEFLTKRLPYSYAFGSSDNVAQYRDIAKTEAFKATLPVFRPSERDSELVTLPKFSEQGWYIVRLASGQAEAWTFVQVTNVASYTVVDKDQVLVWAVNAETKQALTSFPVHVEGGETRLTDGAGLVHLPTPDFLKSTSTTAAPAGVAIIRLGDATGPVQALSIIGPYLNSNPFDRSARAQERTWGYVYPDRPLYRATDDMHVAGIIQDRDHTSPIGQAELRLTKPSYVEDLINGRDRIYASVPLTLDAAGRYEAALSWKNVTPGYYQLDLLREGELVTSRFIEIRTFSKPAYYVDVALSAKRLFAGQEAQMHIQANFFSGAVLPNARMRVRISQGDVTLPDQEVVLNEQGRLDLPVKALPVVCTERLADPCRNTEQLQVVVYPIEGEEAQVLGSAIVDVVGSELDLRGEVKEVNSRAELTLQTYHRDLGKELDEVGVTWSGRKLHGQVVGIRYEKIQDGVWYDAIEKKVTPYYRYERRQDPPVEFALQTDGNGRGTYAFPLRADRDFYEVTVQGEDGLVRSNRFTTSIAHGWYLPEGTGDFSAHLMLEGKGEDRDVHVGEILKPIFQIGTSTFDASQGPGVLFLTLSRGIKQAVHSASASWETTFDVSLLPNATIRGVAFDGKRFLASDTVVFLNKEDQALDVQITTDKPNYRPGDKAQLRFQVRPKAGQALATDVKIAYAMVDESLLSLSGFYEEDPLQWINSYVTDGVLFQRGSHAGDWLFSGGGAEKGGGGSGDRGQGARRLFKDTAGTGVVTLTADGVGLAEVTLPDNLTSWRITAVALGSDLRAGAAKENIQVSKEVFVEAMIPARVLATDQPVIKLRAFGTGLRANETVKFTLDAPSLGLTNYMATGTAGQALYVAVPTLQTGTHVLTVSVSQGDFTDRVERILQVETTRIARDELVTLDPAPGALLSALSPVTTELVVSARGRTSLYPELHALAQTTSLRSDARVAASVARELLQSAYQETVNTEDDSLLDIQTADEGGVHLLPYGSSEVPLTMQVALTKPDVVDAWQLRSYLSGKLVGGGSRLERLQAMAGLAALRAPVVLDLQQAAGLADRTPQETLAIIEGLTAVGDVERAGQLMRDLLNTSLLRDGRRFIQVGAETSPETYEATAEAAALAERLLLPQAKQLNAFVESTWSSEAFPVLAKVRFLAFRLQHIPAEDGSFQWTDGTRTETIQLKDTPFKTIVLSPEQLQNFRVLNVSGPVSLSYLRSVSGLPVKSPMLSLTRRYQNQVAKPFDQFLEGDEVIVTLSPRFASSSPDGCAVLRDDLPANFLPLSQTTLDAPESLFLTSNAVSFLVCKNDPVRDFSYRVKVVARGTYRAEPAILERVDAPSVATYSEAQQFTVR
jgi:hypothetical protein